MKSIFQRCFFLICVMTVFQLVYAKAKTYPLRDAVENSSRGGLPKLKAGKDVKIAYLGGRKREVKRIDGYCHYHRLATLGVGDNLAEVHEVEIKVLGKELDKTKILFKRNLHYLKEHPEKFKGTNWYAGGIMIIGELVK